MHAGFSRRRRPVPEPLRLNSREGTTGISRAGTLSRSAANAVRLGSPSSLAAVTVAVLALGTLAFIANPGLRFAVYAPLLDVALHTLATLVTAAVAALAYVRYREHGGQDALFEAAAFAVLALANLANDSAILAGLDDTLGLSLADPGQLPLYFWAGARLLSSGLLLLGAFGSRRRLTIASAHLRVLLALPSVALALACALLWVVRERVPILVSPDVLRELANETFSTAPLPGINLGILLLDGSAALLLVIAAFVYARADDAPGIPRRYLAIGLVVAAFSQVHFVLYPAIYTGLVSTGDALRIAFYLMLAAGIQSGARADLHALRSANARLRLLAAAEADRTAMAERARLARELHDGLAQDLWTTKLEFDRVMAAVRTRDPKVADELGRVGLTLDMALREARDAVGALRSGFDAGLSFADELPRRLDEFTERTGYPIDLDLDPRAGRLPGVLAAEVLRIVDEALHNVQKHADATRIRVRAVLRDGQFVVSVEDNGRGFNPAVTAAGHGLVGMRERAALLGGSLELRSAPGDGASVELTLPADGLAE